MVDAPAKAAPPAQVTAKEGATIRLRHVAAGVGLTVETGATGFLVAGPRGAEGDAFVMESVSGAGFELRALSNGAPLRLASTPAGPALAALADAPKGLASRLRFGIAKGLLTLKGETGDLVVSNDPTVGVGRIVLVRDAVPARLAPNLVPVSLAVVPATPAAPPTPGLPPAPASTGAPTVPSRPVEVPVRAKPTWLPSAPAAPGGLPPTPALPNVGTAGPRETGATPAGYVLALVRDKRGATQPGVAVRLVEDGRPVDQTRTTAAGIALLRAPAHQPRPAQVRAVEVQGTDQTTSILLDHMEHTQETVAEVVVDAFPPEDALGPADDLFLKLPLHHDVALSEMLLRWTDPQSAGMASSDGPRGRLSGRRWSFSRLVPVARPGGPGKRYLALVRQSWTHVGDAPVELASVRSVLPGVDASERESGAGPLSPVEARRALISEEPLASDAWARAHGSLRATEEANDRAHALARAGAASLALPVHGAAGREWTRERHEGPPSAAVANLFSWRLRSRFAVRSRVQEVLEVHAWRPDLARPLTPADLARWRRVLAPVLGLAPEDAAFARVEALAAETEAARLAVHAVRIQVEGAAAGAAFDLAFALAQDTASGRLGPDRPRDVVQLGLAQPVARDALGTLRVEARPAAPVARLAMRGDAQDEDVRRLAERLHARALGEANGRASLRVERARVEILGGSGLLDAFEVPLPLAVDAGETATLLVPLPGPRQHDPHDDPLFASAAGEPRALAAALFHHAWLHPESRDAVGALLGLDADDPAWSARVLAREGGAILVGAPAARDDPHAQALLADPGDATLVALDTGQSFTDVVLGEGEGADFQRSTGPVTLPPHAATLGGLPGFGLPGLPALPPLPQMPSLPNPPPLPGLEGIPTGMLEGLGLPSGLPETPTPVPVRTPAAPKLPGVPVAPPATPPPLTPPTGAKSGLRRILGGV